MTLFAFAAGMIFFVAAGPSETQVSNVLRRPDPSIGSPGYGPPRQEGAAAVETIRISTDLNGSSRYPAVAENGNGDRLVIFRGPDNSYVYRFCPNNGIWSAAAPIPGQPGLTSHLWADIEVDSTGRFHCVWEQPGETAVYASFLNGSWTTPIAVHPGFSHNYGLGVVVRSDNDLVFADDGVVTNPYLTKDIFLHFKQAGASVFESSLNVSSDKESSSQPSIAVDAGNHLWVAYKSDLNTTSTEDILVIRLAHLDQDNRILDKRIVSLEEGWGFWPQVAVNNEGKVMTAWAYSQSADYCSRLYNPATQTLSPLVPLETGMVMSPWCTFFSRMVARGKDFYIAVMNPGRLLFLLKYDEAAEAWNQVAQISDRGVQMFDLYSGKDKLLVVWGGYDEPADVFLSLVDADTVIPAKPTLTIQSGAGGTTVPAPGAYQYEKDSQVSVKAVPTSGYQFKNWSGDSTETTASITVTMDRRKTVKANFASIPKATLTIQSTPGGTTVPTPGAYAYDKGSIVGIRAVPDDLYRFKNWSGDASGEAVAITVTLDGDKTVKANFAAIPIPKSPLDPALSTALNAALTAKVNMLTWRWNPDNTGMDLKEYRIYRKPAAAADSAFAMIGAVAASTYAYTDSGLPFNVKFTYVLTATPLDPYGRESEKSEPANEISAFPPLDVRCKTVVNNSLFRQEKINVITWVMNPLNEAITAVQHNIYRKKAGQADSEYKLIGSLAGSAVEYQDRRLSFTDSYVYMVRIVDSGGFESRNSNSAGE